MYSFTFSEENQSRYYCEYYYTKCLMLYGEFVTVYFENRTEYAKTSHGHIIIIIIIYLTANWFLPGGSGTTIRQRSNETQHTKLHTQ
jgi:hypothetical protein